MRYGRGCSGTDGGCHCTERKLANTRCASTVIYSYFSSPQPSDQRSTNTGRLTHDDNKCVPSLDDVSVHVELPSSRTSLISSFLPSFLSLRARNKKSFKPRHKAVFCQLGTLRHCPHRVCYVPWMNFGPPALSFLFRSGHKSRCHAATKRSPFYLVLVFQFPLRACTFSLFTLHHRHSRGRLYYTEPGLAHK
jgi:hypothetical protein